MHPHTEALEIATFRLLDCTWRTFLRANAEVDAWLQRQPGFRSRRIARRRDGSVVDMVLWDSVAHGTASARRLMRELQGAAIHALIDPDTVSWDIAAVQHVSGEESDTAEDAAEADSLAA
ncbi:hypothetical protein NB696_000333 [Xanthomonas sacchari]|uniref:hypothetical protein n=1 Tax=Xanthomonas TaxID=338 RepID=UPI00225617CE|nr:MULTISPECIES: hypothetical protein [Xanthomonas]MCW0393989.1 hypothetical protein [Xanthomonas sacchari]MCW0443461.1 hypothetical protein [Xanthomonas sacchari]MCW0463965.1 hypothetical protein [Xanthomonas sacchari]MDY4297311.1 hypothetical protein [Xanthomonas sp. LF02-5]MDY4359105.1 hypothetical protein [Xanthomonas sp. LF04-12]